jgi:hypothetical protein
MKHIQCEYQSNGCHTMYRQVFVCLFELITAAWFLHR